LYIIKFFWYEIKCYSIKRNTGMNLNNLVIVIGLIVALGGCKSCKKQSINDEINIDSLIYNVSDVDFDVLLLPPADLMMFIRDMELKPGITIPPKNVDNLNDTRSKSVNLGIYMADIVYLGVRNNKIEIPKYLKSVKQISDELKIYNVFTEEITQRLEKNIYNPDSLFIISGYLQDSFVSNLKTSGRQNILALASLGAFVESLYLTVLNLDNYVDFNEVSHEMMNQKVLFDQYYSYLRLFLKDPKVSSTIKDIEPLNDFFFKVEIKSEEKKVIKDETGYITILGGDELILAQEDFEVLKSTIVKVRNQLASLY